MDERTCECIANDLDQYDSGERKFILWNVLQDFEDEMRNEIENQDVHANPMYVQKAKDYYNAAKEIREFLAYELWR